MLNRGEVGQEGWGGEGERCMVSIVLLSCSHKDEDGMHWFDI